MSGIERLGRCALVSALVAALVTASLRSPDALAQAEVPAAQIARARELTQEGVALAEQGECPAAIEKLAQADQLYKAAVTLAYLGECRVKVGKLVLGTENLRVALRMPDQGRDAIKKAQARAQPILDAALPRLAKLTVSVRMPAGVQPQITLDGEPLAPALLNGEIPADPGAHALEFKAAGYLPERQSINLAEGGKAEVTFTPRADTTPAATGSSSAASSPLPPASASSLSPSPSPAGPAPIRRYVGYGLVGVGAVGLIAGSVFGISAASKKTELDETCKNKTCPITSESKYESARTSATLSTVGIGVGLGAAAFGLVLLFTEGSSGAATARRLPGNLAIGGGPGHAGVGLSGEL